MVRLIAERLALGVLTMLMVSVLVFAATEALPGDPAQAILGKTATPSRLAALRRELNLNRPLVSQYGSWLFHAVHGDLGNSLANRHPVAGFLEGRIENSAFLVGMAAVVTIPLSIAVGVLLAIRRESVVAHTVTTTSLALVAVPEFVIATVLVVMFGTTVFHWLPPVSLIPPGEPAWQHLELVWLPVAALVLVVAPYISRIMRASMIEVLESDYVEMARLKGLPERTVILWHALPNGVVPAIQVTALQLGYMVGGIVVIEYVFAYPGVGGALVDAVSSRDLPVIQAIVLFIAGFYIAVNLIADILTILVTPRLRTAR